MEKLKELSPKGSSPEEATKQGAQEAPSATRKVMPRAVVFKACDKDFDKIKHLIKKQFPEVEIIYVTTGPAASILRVTKSIPFERQNSPEQPLYTIE